MIPGIVICRSLVFAVPLLVLAPICAQTNKEDSVVKLEAKKTAVIPVRNVKATIVAQWLDPVKNPIIRHIYTPARLFVPQPKGPVPPVPVKLPVGVERVTVLQEENTLLVVGTDAGIQATRELVRQLDKPVTQYSLEAWLLEVKGADIEKLFGATTAGLIKQSGQRLLAVEMTAEQSEALVATQKNRPLGFTQVQVYKDAAVVFEANHFHDGRRSDISPPMGMLGGSLQLEAVVSEPNNSLIVTLDLSLKENPPASAVGKVRYLGVDTGLTCAVAMSDGGTAAIVNVPKPLRLSWDHNDAGSHYVLAVRVQKVRESNDKIVLPVENVR